MLSKKISDCGGDQNNFFAFISISTWETDSISTAYRLFNLASVFNKYFITQIADIRKEFPVLESHAAPLSIIDFKNTYNLSPSCLSSFTPTTVSKVQELLSIMNHTTCLLDPFNTKIIMQNSEHFIRAFFHIFNPCFSIGTFPASLKAAVIRPLLKKTLS